MQVCFQDFHKDYDERTLEGAVKRLNDCVAENKVTVVNVETIFEGLSLTDTSKAVTGVRLWYLRPNT